MGAVMNGMAVSGLLPAGGTFFVFSDYMRPAVRLAALVAVQGRVRVDARLRRRRRRRPHAPADRAARVAARDARLRVIRPADANESRQAWRVHIDGDGPTAILLTRQNVPVLDGTAERAPEGVARGAYVLVDEADDGLDLVLIGTGSEVSLCVGARASCSPPTGSRCGSCRCRRGTSSRRSPTTTATRCSRRACPTLAVEAGAQLRLGALRRRRRRHRPLRRVGAGRRGDDGVRLHPRERRRARPRAARHRRHVDDQCDRPAERVRAEPLVRQPHPRARYRRWAARSS